MNLSGSFIAFGVSTAVRVLTGLVSNKILAVYLGPVGLALTGNFSNFLLLSSMFTGGVLNSGVVTLTASPRNSEEKAALIRTAVMLALTASLVLALLTIYYRRTLSHFLFDTDDYSYVFLASAGMFVPVA